MRGEGELWHVVEAKRDDGTPTTFQIRELEPQKQLSRIFVVEMPYPTTEMSRLPNALAYRTLRRFEEEWLWPACSSLGWELVGRKIEDGSFFLYMYGAAEPDALMSKLAPFDAALGFYDDHDPEWEEYGTLRELLEQARALHKPKPEPEPAPKAKPATKAKAPAKPQPKARARKRATAKPKTKPRPSKR